MERSRRKPAIGVDVHSFPCQSAPAAFALSAFAGSSGTVPDVAGDCETGEQKVGRVNRANVQAWCVVLQRSLLKIRRDHAVPAHIEWGHLARHHGLLPHEVVVLLFP